MRAPKPRSPLDLRLTPIERDALLRVARGEVTRVYRQAGVVFNASDSVGRATLRHLDDRGLLCDGPSTRRSRISNDIRCPVRLTRLGELALDGDD